VNGDCGRRGFRGESDPQGANYDYSNRERQSERMVVSRDEAIDCLYTVNTSTGIHFTIADSNESSLVAATAIPGPGLS
jgi:hypothetical protein